MTIAPRPHNSMICRPRPLSVVPIPRPEYHSTKPEPSPRRIQKCNVQPGRLNWSGDKRVMLRTRAITDGRRSVRARISSRFRSSRVGRLSPLGEVTMSPSPRARFPKPPRLPHRSPRPLSSVLGSSGWCHRVPLQSLRMLRVRDADLCDRRSQMIDRVPRRHPPVASRVPRTRRRPLPAWGPVRKRSHPFGQTFGQALPPRGVMGFNRLQPNCVDVFQASGQPGGPSVLTVPDSYRYGDSSGCTSSSERKPVPPPCNGWSAPMSTRGPM